MSEPYKISLGIDINESELNALKSKINGIETDTIKLKLDTSNVDKQLNNIKKQIEQLGNIKINLGSVSAGRTGSGSINELTKEMTKFVNLQKKISNMKLKIGGLEAIGGKSNQITTLNKQLETLETTYSQLMGTFTKKLSVSDISVGDVIKFDDEINEAVTKAEWKLEELEAKIADTRAELARKLEIKLETGKFSTQVQKVHSDAKKLSVVSSELKQGLKILDSAEREMNNAFKTGTVEQKIQAYKNYERTLESVENQLKQNKIAEQDANSLAALEQKKKGLSLDMDNWLNDNSAAAKKFGATIRELKIQLESCDNVQYGNIKREFQNIKKEAKSLGLTTQTLGDKIKSQFSKYSSYLSVASVFMYTTQAMRDMFNQVVAIDSAMTELKKVTDETSSTYDKFLSNAASRAKEIGTTIDGIVSSTADFARLGYDFEDAQGLAEVANIYAVVGDEVEGVEGATESLISTMAAFKDEMSGLSDTDFAMSIIDKFNEIGNKFAISSGGIGEALERSASSLNAANNSIDESIALITAANTVVGLCHAA